MPIKVQNELPAKKILEDENIFMMDEHRAVHQDIRPLQIAILNLMPLKEETEVQLLRSLSNTPLQLEVTFLTTKSYTGKNTASSHLEKFYLTHDLVEHMRFDGLIITGAPVELLKFEEVEYWEELKTIMAWSITNVTSTLHLCWGAQAGLYYHYGIQKKELNHKVFGVFPHKVMNRREPFVRGFDDIFYAPHSRHTEMPADEVKNTKGLTVLSESEEAGLHIIMADAGHQFFVMGHPEYDRVTLDKEYHRDQAKGLNTVSLPLNYYPDNNPENKPSLLWRAHANTMYSNWLNYYVYQVTPFEL